MRIYCNILSTLLYVWKFLWQVVEKQHIGIYIYRSVHAIVLSLSFLKKEKIIVYIALGSDLTLAGLCPFPLWLCLLSHQLGVVTYRVRVTGTSSGVRNRVQIKSPLQRWQLGTMTSLSGISNGTTIALCNIATEAAMRSLIPSDDWRWHLAYLSGSTVRWHSFCCHPWGAFQRLQKNRRRGDGKRVKEIGSYNYLQLPNLFILISPGDSTWETGILKACLLFLTWKLFLPLTCKYWKQTCLLVPWLVWLSGWSLSLVHWFHS